MKQQRSHMDYILHEILVRVLCSKLNPQVLLVCPPLIFPEIRNYLARSELGEIKPMREECTRNGMNIVHLSQRLFIGVSDYDGPDVGRSAMGMLSDGVVRSVLMSERWYFYNRERLHGASNVIFLAPPFFPEFYVDFVKSLTHFVKGSTIMMLTNVFYAQDLCRITGKEIGIDLLTSRGTKDGRKTVKFSSKSP
eukprot:gnl/Carplike_NY0171/13073_a19006_108.p1 GENE.gnl/Carplike_NY0171/13073_a19006_108~~gnl/Carplike_NY0171/13073_a19006_108.p1  ORF type:complete len:194 (-),score=34.29 gnl/Carplike_NY0171/13073_a19006_108:236-817(-)